MKELKFVNRPEDKYKKANILSILMKRVNIFLIFLICLSFASAAQESLGTFKQDDCVSLTQICGDCTYNTLLSVQYPDGTKEIIQENMTKNLAEFNYTFCNTSQLGNYNVNGVGDLSGEETAWAYSLLITPTGDTIETAESFLYVSILIILGILAALGIYVSIIIPYDNISEDGPEGKVILKVTKTKYVKLIVMWVTSGILLTFLTILVGMVNNYVQFPEMKVIFTNTYTWLRVLSYGFSMIMIFFLFVNFWRDIVFNRQIIKHGKAFVNRNL